MTSMDSGVETGNDSNDSSATQHDNASAMQVNSVATTTVSNSSVTPSQSEEQEQLDKDKDVPKKLSFNGPAWPVDFNFSSLCPEFEPFRPSDNDDHATGASTSSSLPLVPCSRFKSLERDRRICNFNGKVEILHSSMRTRRQAKFLKSIGDLWNRNPYLANCKERKMRLASATNNIELMKRLLNDGISPNNQDDQGRTPLHLASCRGYTEIVKLLLEHGANPNKRDCLGNAPLHLAVVTSKMAVVSLLLKAGTDVLSWDEFGFNPVQLAQTKLKILQSCQGSDMEDLKKEVQCIVTILLLYFQRQKDAQRKELEALSNICSRLSLSNTTDQVRDEVRDILSSIESLSITS